jgi:hypothetical protein
MAAPPAPAATVDSHTIAEFLRKVGAGHIDRVREALTAALTAIEVTNNQKCADRHYFSNPSR